MERGVRSTRFFTLRMWKESDAEGEPEWRGKLQALPEGEAFYFRGWRGLIARLEGVLEVAGQDEGGAGGPAPPGCPPSL